MPIITIETLVQASPECCFDAARDLDLHVASMAHTAERAVAGRMTGLIERGEEVTWEARHFGVRQRFTSKITAFDRPRHFRDAMTRGAFRSFVHDHFFAPVDGGTRIRDVLEFSSPFGIIGRIVDRLILTGYLRRLLLRRNEVVRRALETSL